MTWRDELKQATLDGVPFDYTEVSGEFGADVIIHRISTSGLPVSEPISEGEDSFSFNAFIVGDDYFAGRDDLVRVLNTPSNHTLVHPTRGTHEVALDGRARMTESLNEQGLVRISFTLVKVENQAFPIIRDARTELTDQVAVVNLQLLEVYQRRFRLGAFVGGILSAINLATAAMLIAQGKIQAAMNIAQSFGNSVTGFLDQADSLLRQPGQFISGLTSTAIGIFAGITSFADDLPNPVSRSQSTFEQVFDQMFNQPRPELEPTTREGQLEQDNAVQTWIANRVSAVSAASNTLAELQFTSSDEVFAFQDKFLANFDALASEPDLDDALYVELRQLKANVFGFLQTVAQQLPSLTKYTTAKTLPALVIAYNLYEDANRDHEIVDRNNISRPTFVPPRTLEVLSD